MKIPLCRRGFTFNRRRSWRNDNRGLRITFGDRVVRRFAIIRAVRRHRGYIAIDLLEQVRYLRDVTNIVRRQFDRDDLMRGGIDPEVKLAPPSARPDTVFLIEPFAFSVYLEASAVDQEMQWLSAVNVLRQYRQAAASSADRHALPSPARATRPRPHR